jgi:thioredoxin 1
LLLVTIVASGCGSSGGAAGGDGGASGTVTGATRSTVAGEADTTVTSETNGTVTSQAGGATRIEATTVTDSTFDDQVIHSDKAVLVHFWAEWCGPCRVLTPVLEEIADVHVDKLMVARLNVDENPQTPDRFGVKSIPTLLLFVDGVEKKRLTGSMTKSSIESELAESIG